MRVLAAAGVVMFALACTACGGRRANESSDPWRADAAAALRQLQSDIDAAEVGGTTRTSARRALRSFSDLYMLSFAFADLAGCHTMVARAGSPIGVAHELVRPCVGLERAARLFTRAVSKSDPSALVHATREVQRAEPALVQALASVRR